MRPGELRQSFNGLPKMTLIRRAVALRPGPIENVTAATKQAIRAIANRWLALDEEIKSHDLLLNRLTTSIAPDLLDDGTVSKAYGTLGEGMHANLPGHSFVLIDAAGVQRWYGEYPSMWLDPSTLISEVSTRLK